MIVRRWSAEGRTSRGPTRDDLDYYVSAAPVENIEGGSSSEVTINGAVYDRVTGGALLRSFQLAIEKRGIVADFDHEWVAHDPDIATVDGFGRVTQVSTGTARFSARNRLRSVGVELEMENAASLDTFNRWDTGTNEKAASDELDALLDSEKVMQVYSTYNSGVSYIRNPDCWLYGIDLTGISAWNSLRGRACPALLLTPRHVEFRAHWGPPIRVGDKVHFVTQANVMVECTITHTNYVGGSVDGDQVIALLDSDVPGTITPLKFSPSDVHDYFPRLSTIPNSQLYGPVVRLPVGRIDQFGDAQVNDLIRFARNSYREREDATIYKPSNPDRLDFYNVNTGWISVFYGPEWVDHYLNNQFVGYAGESGTSAFMVIQGEAMQVGSMYLIGAAGRVSQDDTNTAIGALDTAAGISTGYTVSTFDLTVLD